MLSRIVQKKIVSFNENSEIAFPDEIDEKQPDADRFETLVDEIYNQLSNYSQKISLVELEENSHIVSAFKTHLEDMERKITVWNKRMKQTADSKLNKDLI